MESGSDHAEFFLAFKGIMAFSGQIWAQTAHPVHKVGSILTFPSQMKKAGQAMVRQSR